MKLKLGCAPYVEGSTVGGGTLVSPVNGKEAGPVIYSHHTF